MPNGQDIRPKPEREEKHKVKQSRPSGRLSLDTLRLKPASVALRRNPYGRLSFSLSWQTRLLDSLTFTLLRQAQTGRTA